MAETIPATVWDGAWVSENLGVRLEGSGLPALVGLALRDNPRRAHLLVSHVLGKHIPVEPHRVLGAARALAERVRALRPGPYAVLGYAETATGLGHGVASALGSDDYLHSTRRPVAGLAPWRGFEEEHSHATGHLLLPDRADPLAAPTVVLVDDELSTGRTVANTVRALPAGAAYLAAALVDVRA
ncbi:MAG: phosphoribosyltransferase, partial [Jatrophihabitans sp.]